MPMIFLNSFKQKKAVTYTTTFALLMLCIILLLPFLLGHLTVLPEEPFPLQA